MKQLFRTTTPYASISAAHFSRLLIVIAAIAGLSLAGCASNTRGGDIQTTRVTNDGVSITHSNRETMLSSNVYNGEHEPTKENPNRYIRSKALGDYDARLVDLFIRSQADQAADWAAATGSRIELTGDTYARWNRLDAGVDLGLGLLGLSSRSLASIGAGFIIGSIGDKDGWYATDLREKQAIRAGATLTIAAVDDQTNPQTREGRLSAALKMLRAADVPIAPKARNNQDFIRIDKDIGFAEFASGIQLIRREATASTLRVSGVPPREGTYGPFALKSDDYVLSYYHQNPLAKRHPNGVYTRVMIPHVYYQDRKDGIDSARDLYEKKLLPSGTVPDGWYVIYTDIDPTDGKPKIFVSQKGNPRMLILPVPPVPQF